MQDDETLVRQIMAELQSLRNKLYEEQEINLKLEEQSSLAKSIQKRTQRLLNDMEEQIRQQVSCDDPSRQP